MCSHARRRARTSSRMTKCGRPSSKADRSRWRSRRATKPSPRAVRPSGLPRSQPRRSRGLCARGGCGWTSSACHRRSAARARRRSPSRSRRRGVQSHRSPATCCAQRTFGCVAQAVASTSTTDTRVVTTRGSGAAGAEWRRCAPTSPRSSTRARCTSCSLSARHRASRRSTSWTVCRSTCRSARRSSMATSRAAAWTTRSRQCRGS